MRLGFIAENNLEGLKEDALFSVENGFEGLEFNYWATFADLDLDTVKTMKGILDDFGIPCTSLGLWGWNHTAPDADERAESLRQLDRAIDFAQVLEAPTFITGGGLYSDSLDENVAAFAEVMPPYLKRITDAGMRPAMVALHGNSFFDTIESYKRVFDLFPKVGMKIDPANLAGAGLDYLPYFREIGDRLWEVHIKEAIYIDGKWASQPAAGMGDIQWGKIFAFLYEHGYDGDFIIEPHGPIWSKGEMKKKMLTLTQRYIRPFML